MKHLLVCLALFSAAAAQANLVTNGDFETGDFTGWTQFGHTGHTNVRNGGVGGAKVGRFGPVNGVGGIQQDVAVSTGNWYRVEFDLAVNVVSGTSSTNSFYASFDGETLVSFSNAAPSGYTHYSYLLPASDPSAHLEFGFQNVDDYYYLDNVSVTQSVPEPASMAALGIGAVALLRRRRKA